MARDDDFDFTDDDFQDEDEKPKAKKKPEESEEERIGREITEASQREPFEPEPDPDDDDGAKAEAGQNEGESREERQNRSQKRINELVREREEAKRQNAQMQERLRQLEGEVSKVSGVLSEREVEAKSADIDGKLGDLRKQYRDAIEAGDTDKQIELNEQILDARIEKRDFDRRVKEQKERPSRATDQRRGESEAARQPQSQPAKAPELSPEGHKWIGRNADWFLDPKFANEHNDTREIDVGLYKEWVQSGKLESGKMPNDPEYFRELERRLFSKHPHLQPKGGSPGATTAPQGRSAASRSGRGNGQYKFTKTEAQQMVKMGLDPSSERDRKYWQRERARS